MLLYVLDVQTSQYQPAHLTVADAEHVSPFHCSVGETGACVISSHSGSAPNMIRTHPHYKYIQQTSVSLLLSLLLSAFNTIITIAITTNHIPPTITTMADEFYYECNAMGDCRSPWGYWGRWAFLAFTIFGFILFAIWCAYVHTPLPKSFGRKKK